jgi:hypothetical protein
VEGQFDPKGENARDFHAARRFWAIDAAIIRGGGAATRRSAPRVAGLVVD